MIAVRKSEARGHANHGWLDSYHTFSFANYYDRNYMNFRSLRVINEDVVNPGKGFGTHGHSDMEIITYVLEGALEHKDSLGTGAVIKPGEVQRMSAGTGIQHSEFNPSQTDPVHLLQIWLLPDTNGLEPSYEQRDFPLTERRGKLRLVAARDARDGAVKVHQDVDLYAAVLDKNSRVSHVLQPNRHAWIQVARGAVLLNGLTLEKGDGAAVSDEAELVIEAAEDAEFLLFDLA
ncbi:MAG: pirin family protein [Microcoleus sp. PH2017_40_RAT_O_B]|jgi:quercetin 2,3-dioxygenase|uniref:pirin family protein n=1 Tax=unclassified Microcoleus TaxID=2642155 RepID=UPI001DA6DC5F|nr:MULTISPECIES: pirin family protein [unclassified Microcoleus]TAG66074.1 MAG: pirin family protein [Oscillatoriales cyanobacterium]MCC3565188.1 pirin family protein [Microcoleus sp. PH2017_31_RDM_U_A]MCC3572891.1 pirin family protein [Microcoleus sp. PH2017_34_RAT_O_A]MCC3577454.1 pirin family protein [Microcoleus sp. PH2017_32_RDM_D_A]MCC3612750.1 pirin family protein [Microcoleus sp. PH2017_40_RAT_O_B]